MGSKDLKTILAIILASFLIGISSHSSADNTVLSENDKEEMLHKFYLMEIPFLENGGQIKDGNVKYYARTLGVGFFITGDGQISYFLTKSGEGKAAGGWTIRESFAGVFPLEVKGEERIAVGISEFKGKDPSEWKMDIPAYDRVIIAGIQTGIELSLKAYGGGLEKLFYIEPPARIEGVKLQIEGAKGLKSNASGEIEIETDIGILRFEKPLAYQEENGKINYVEVDYVVSADGYGFAVGEYDGAKGLVISSSLISTYAGTALNDTSSAITTDENDNIYIAGITPSPDFPFTPGPYNTTDQDPTDVFIAKLDINLSYLLGTALLGGSNWEQAYALKIDNLGDVYIAGGTTSADFPITPDAYSNTYKGGEDAFLAKLDKNLQTLLSSSYFGEYGNDRITSISIDSRGNVSVAGTTTSRDISALFGASGGSLPDSPNPFTATFDPNLNPYLPSQLSDKDSGETALSAPSLIADPSQADSKKPRNPVGEGWFNATADPVSPEKARAYYEKKQMEKAALNKGIPTFRILSDESTSPEIVELARALRNDPKLIYDYVHNNIDYVPYYGSLKGATLTYLDGSGNDFDQASLMIALLRASGFTSETAKYVYGTMIIFVPYVAEWVGVDNDVNAISGVLSLGGIPFSNAWFPYAVLMNRV